MPNAIVNGITIDYSTAGDGPPILLICGTGQPADLWFAQVADLTAAGHTVITFDNRGCGRSEAPPAPYSVTGMAADTAALVEHLGLPPGWPIIQADYPRLVVTRRTADDTVYILRPPGEDPRAVLRAARLILPEDHYEELAAQLGITPNWPLE